MFFSLSYINFIKDSKAVQHAISKVSEVRKRELKSVLSAAAKRVYFGQENFTKQWFKFAFFESAETSKLEMEA